MYLHLFKCVPAEVFAATPDSRGANLPSGVAKGSWRYLRGVTVMPADSPSMALDPQAVLAGVETRGYHIWGSGLRSPSPPPQRDASEGQGACA